MDLRLELVAVPVSDVDRAKAFYERVGFVVDHDHVVSEQLRFVQLTPPGSPCSVTIGTGITEAAPGSFPGANLVVDDAEQAHVELTRRGIEVSEIEDMPWGRFVTFADPDGNRWSLQEVPSHAASET